MFFIRLGLAIQITGILNWANFSASKCEPSRRRRGREPGSLARRHRPGARPAPGGARRDGPSGLAFFNAGMYTERVVQCDLTTIL